jgi:uncharacterized protein
MGPNHIAAQAVQCHPCEVRRQPAELRRNYDHDLRQLAITQFSAWTARVGCQGVAILHRNIQTCPMSTQPLSDQELDTLTGILVRFGAKGAMNLEQLDGFFAALIAGPDDVLPSEYLPEIWGDGIVNERTFRAQAILQDFLSLVTRHWNAVSQTLRSGNVYTPLLIDDDNGVSHGNDWANGFLRGMELRREGWAPLLDDEDRGGSLVAIFALAHEHDPDPEMRSYDKPIPPELREKLIIGVAVGVMQIYRYFETRRLMPTSMGATYRRVVRKVGRNDPCPCGSGKKYKQCCGRITLH